MAPNPPERSERPGVAGGAPRSPAPRRALLVCVALTFVLHVATYLLNTQLPLHLLALGGSHAHVGWLFGVTTLVGLALRPQVGGWTDRYGARAVMAPGVVARSEASSRRSPTESRDWLAASSRDRPSSASRDCTLSSSRDKHLLAACSSIGRAQAAMSSPAILAASATSSF